MGAGGADKRMRAVEEGRGRSQRAGSTFGLGHLKVDEQVPPRPTEAALGLAE